MIRILILLFLIFALNGCFIAPGMKMQSPPNAVRYKALTAKSDPHFIALDVDLVNQMNRFGMSMQDDAYYYHVGPHDVLNVYVWGHPELNGPIGQASNESGAGNASISPVMAPVGYLVTPDGRIFFPLVGMVHVAGKTVQQNRIQLTNRLRRYIRNPQLDVRVTNFRSKKIYVLGEVNKPGLQPITDAPMSITDAISFAGGMIPDSADPSHIFVIRGDYARPDVYWLNAKSPDALLLAQNFRLKDHDVVFISTADITRWNRAINQILPSIQTVWYTNSLINSG